MKIKTKYKQGFTLLELMVAITIMALIMTYAGIDYAKGAPQRRIEGAAWEIMTLMRKARMMATVENTSVTVTPDAPAKTVSIWMDANDNGIQEGEEVETISLDSDITMYVYPGPGAFNSRGMFTSAGAYMYISLWMNGTSGETLYVYPSGQVDLYYY